MQWIACFLSLFFFFFMGTVQAAVSSSVRVRITSLSSEITLSGSHLRFIGLESGYRPTSGTQNRKVQIARVVVAGRTYWQISQESSPSLTKLVSSQNLLMIQGEGLRQGATELPNKILLRENNSGDRDRTIDLIGVVPLEEYVLAVLTNEMPLSWPLETLKAQAVAIRSYTRATMLERETNPFHVESSVLDQVYRKISGLKPELLAKARQAVAETEGITLLNLKKRPLKAFYHADCGGRTVAASSVWKQETDNDVGVANDSFCAYNPRSRWTLTIAKEKFQRLLKSYTGAIHSNEFRKLIGFMDLKSTQFEVFEKEDQIQFVGRGFGHGAGMCQWGSKYLGAQGLTYQRILKHYYPLAILQSNSF